jgi:hypothetical protein
MMIHKIDLTNPPSISRSPFLSVLALSAPVRMRRHFSPPRLILLSLLASAFLGTSCTSPSFRKAWNSAAESQGVAGKWQGQWSSAVNGHHGELQCVVTEPAQPGQPHQFFYRATWMRLLSGSYRAAHVVSRSNADTWAFSGQHALPDWAGGLYKYEGAINKDSFTASYRSALDQGTYKMSRVHSEKESPNNLAKPASSR